MGQPTPSQAFASLRLHFSSVVGSLSTRLGVNKIMTLELVRLIAHLSPAPSLLSSLSLSPSLLRGSSYLIQLVLIILLYLPTNN